jgi:hypothetical protein
MIDRFLETRQIWKFTKFGVLKWKIYVGNKRYMGIPEFANLKP